MKNIFLAIFLPIVLFFVWGWMFSFFPKTKTGTISKWLFASVVIFFFWKDLLSQGPEVIIPLVFTIVIILSLLFFDTFKKYHDGLIALLVNKYFIKNSINSKLKNETEGSSPGIANKLLKGKNK